MSKPPEKAFDEALENEDAPTDPEYAHLIETARLLRSSLHVEPPAARGERAMFIQGIRSRRPVPVLRFALPVLAGAALLVMVMLGQGALPGQTLYPVKEALASVGLAPSAVEDIDRRIEAARDYISEAEDILAVDAREARSHALEAIADLDRARNLLGELNQRDRTERLRAIRALEDRAIVILGSLGSLEPEVLLSPSPSAQPTPDDDNSGSGSDDELENDDEDHSGPGGGGDDDSDDDDNSGSGSDDSDDNSGSGSDDSGGDDNSGSGSDDSGGDDDSGSGSDDSDDNSGSGSDKY